jgi:hypothetical protein
MSMRCEPGRRALITQPPHRLVSPRPLPTTFRASSDDAIQNKQMMKVPTVLGRLICLYLGSSISRALLCLPLPSLYLAVPARYLWLLSSSACSG